MRGAKRLMRHGQVVMDMLMAYYKTLVSEAGRRAARQIERPTRALTLL